MIWVRIQFMGILESHKAMAVKNLDLKIILNPNWAH